MAAARRRFRPGVPATIFAGFFLPLLLALGTWQVDRAGEKQALFDDFAAGGEAVALEANSRGLEELRRYAPVRAMGRYLADRQFLLDNMVAGGQAGYRVITPLLIAEGHAVLVDRGWLPRDFSTPVPPPWTRRPSPAGRRSCSSPRWTNCRAGWSWSSYPGCCCSTRPRRTVTGATGGRRISARNAT